MSGLPLLFNVVLSLGVAALGIWVGRRAHRREPISDASHVLKHSPHLWLMLVLPVLLLAYHLAFVARPDWEWRLPYPVQYYYAPVAWGLLIGCFTYFAGFGGAVFLETRHPQRRQLGAAMLLLLGAMQMFHHQSTTRIKPEVQGGVTTAEGYTYQTSAATCVPAATATLLAVLGERRSEAELVELLGTDIHGTYPSQLVMAMRRLGFQETTVSIDRAGLAAVPTPAVVFLRNGSHSVTLLRFDQDSATIWNPEPPQPGGPPGGRLVIDRTAFGRYFAGAYAVSFQRRDSRKLQAGSQNGGF
jgi:hypothetical protein